MAQINKKYGLTPIRKCSQQEQNLLKDKLQEYKETLEKNRSNAIYWVHIFLHGDYCWQSQEKETKFKEWVQKLLLEVEGGVHQQIYSYGFSNNPCSSTTNQPYHFDYNLQYKNIFIPMTYLVYENSPQFIPSAMSSQPLLSELEAYEQYGKNDKHLLEHQGKDFIIVNQVISKPYVILKLQAGTVHRGIKNRTNQDRYMFYIGYGPNKTILPHEKPVFVTNYQQTS